ncbi:hypothetical protein [Crateriforma conspicua]|uniref:hypothetical protein n=1 Tax=Crateriforma conspicua TaxID=2527996 RepID=UPI0018CD3A2E|nr:hypothetical protein [Crateriforma conspicua]
MTSLYSQWAGGLIEPVRPGYSSARTVVGGRANRPWKPVESPTRMAGPGGAATVVQDD